jgi:hypothetical protein
VVSTGAAGTSGEDSLIRVIDQLVQFSLLPRLSSSAAGDGCYLWAQYQQTTGGRHEQFPFAAIRIARIIGNVNAISRGPGASMKRTVRRKTTA